jgi:hypothetical protein
MKVDHIVALIKKEPTVKPENIMWLLLAMFMIHDFEEIIMMPAWLQKHQGAFGVRFPSFVARLLKSALNRSTSAFALAVAEEFLLLTVFTVFTVQRELYALWAGMLLAYFLHLVIHMGQWIVFRSYTPAILTSVWTSIYCLYAFWYMNSVVHIEWDAMVVPTLICMLIIAINLALSLRLADWFDEWLRNYAKGSES